MANIIYISSMAFFNLSLQNLERLTVKTTPRPLNSLMADSGLIYATGSFPMEYVPILKSTALFSEDVSFLFMLDSLKGK